jgi:hypothetical protein
VLVIAVGELLGSLLSAITFGLELVQDVVEAFPFVIL